MSLTAWKVAEPRCSRCGEVSSNVRVFLTRKWCPVVGMARLAASTAPVAIAHLGELHVVGNRHLAYHAKLKKLFGNCTTRAGNGKFVVLVARRQ